MDKNRPDIDSFLLSAGWNDARRAPLAGDASQRRYLRLHRLGDPTTAILMDAPPASGEDIRPFLKIARYLSTAGLSAPRIYAHDDKAGLILMEDLGDGLFSRICTAASRQERPLYHTAVSLLAGLHQIPPPADLAGYTNDIYDRESSLAIEWYLPAVTGRGACATDKTDFSNLIRTACDRLGPFHSVCVLRDYHAENLIWLPARNGPAKVGLLDFQDALLGHPAYDLVSLLEDARRDTTPDLRAEMVDFYLEETRLERSDFLRSYATLGAQRNLKIIGIFTRLFKRDGKPGYLDLIPRVWDHLQTDLEHPSLAGLRAFVEKVFPTPTEQILRCIRDAANDA